MISNRKWRGVAIAAVVCGAAATSAARAEDVYVAKPSVVVREGKGSVHPAVATVRKGERLTVVAREGKWLKVQVGKRQGYVFDASVSPTPVRGGPSLGEALGSNAEASRTSAGAAAKGLEPQAEAYADEKNLDREPLEEMVRLNRSIEADELEKFMADGDVGPR